jgi:hypothetical protein
MNPKSKKIAEWLTQIQRWHGWGPLCIVVLIVAGGGGAFLFIREARDTRNDIGLVPAQNGQTAPNQPIAIEAPTVTMRLPPPQTTAIESITYANMNGKRVVRLMLVPNGDEMIVDCATGKFLEVKRGPTASLPLTKPTMKAVPIPVPRTDVTIE